jgi:hypothetical protein
MLHVLRNGVRMLVATKFSMIQAWDGTRENPGAKMAAIARPRTGFAPVCGTLEKEERGR